ncbi:response regulator [Paenibacillus sp. SYP-B4298]|uniref:response regulator n=1 Tax=Paenibacillus sp. SYP-B4298 TaxID=2996034 RepID=UPI0022DE8B7B|nr:response regulator [Paenibacillus sp. SYP-B4298]
MRAILVDDEKLALMHLKKMLERDVQGVEVVGMFTDPVQVLDEAKKLSPDVMFLDIQMPEINGLEMGEQLQLQLPSTEIVFVTGYDQYAVQAFDLCALDYLMKPINRERLRKTVDRLRARLDTHKPVYSRDSQVMLHCFQSLKLQLQGGEPELIRWRTNKAQELFAYLLHSRQRMVNRDTLIELFWPDIEPDRGATQLYTTIYLIRRVLKTFNAGIDLQKGRLDAGYKLDIGDVLIDSEEWERQLKELPPLDVRSAPLHERILFEYKGDYFGDYGYLWAEPERERLRRLWIHHVQQLSEFYYERSLLSSAISINQFYQQLYPLDEQSYYNLMRCYAAGGKTVGVEQQYDLLSSRLELELDMKVSSEIRRWYEQWRSERGVS